MTIKDKIVDSIDAFGQPIGLSYKGKIRYKTGCGALCTLTIIAIILSYILLSLLVVMPATIKDAHSEVVSSV